MLAKLLADVLPPNFPLFPVLAGLGGVFVIVVLLVLLRPRGRTLDVGRHGEDLAEYPAPPPVQDCQLLYLNEPVRVRLIILAPLGRGDIPADAEALLDRAIRGFGAVAAQDRPAWRTWPAQLSWKGFLPIFTRYVRLPTGPEEPSQYQLVCGQIRLGNRMVAIGLVLQADEAVHRPTRRLEAHQWAEQFRVERFR